LAEQYFCQNEKRRQAVREHPTLNGIDYLEVLDHDAPPGSPRQQTLLVHCLKPLPALTANNVRVEGGVRITPVRVLWAAPGSTLTVPPATAAEQAYVAGLPDPNTILVVRTDSSGDFSRYRLVLVDSPTNPAPPAGFDPQLSAVGFSFKVECPSDFDCQVDQECPPETLPEPRIDYLAKDYASFRRLMLDRLSTVMPDWTERNPADVGVAIVETVAYVADQLSYFQDAVATEAYLGTARRRVSVRRHARLLDYAMHEGCNARAWVQVQVESAGIVLPAGSQLLTRFDAPRGAVSPDRLPEALAQGALVFETLQDLPLFEAHNDIRFYTWGDDECCLPRGATRASLLNTGNQLQNLAPGDVLIFEERISPTTGLAPDADPAHRHAVRLTAVTFVTDPLNNTPVAEIEWYPLDALPFPLCLSAADPSTGGVGIFTDVSVARGNIALADHGRTFAGEALVPAIVPMEGRYRPHLQRGGITHRVAYDDAAARARPANGLLAQDPRAALPAVELDGDDAVWLPRRDLLNSDRFASEFVVEMENDGRASLRFGEGVHGRAPGGGSVLAATYRVGNGQAGNVGAEALAHVVSLEGITNVRNPLPAEGGTDAEGMEQVRLYAPQAFRTQERAVTEADYAAVAQRHPEVQKAVARFRWTGSWYTTFVAVDRTGGRPVDAAFETDLRGFLERFRMAGQDLEIDGPRFVPLEVAFTVCVAPGYFRSNVLEALRETFSNADLPDGRRGFFHPDNFTFGQPVYLSQVVSAAMGVPGVQWVDFDATPPKPNRFQRWGKLPQGELAAGRISMGRLEIARLDNDPSQPENGRIEFFMEGGL
jgi:hypothetical protein